MSSTATACALTLWDLDTRRSGPTIPAIVTSASCSGRSLFVGNSLPKPVANSTCVSPAWNGVRQVLPRVRFERSSLFQYSNGAHLFHLLRLPPLFNWSIRRSPRNMCSLSDAFAPHASSVTALYGPRENFLPRTNLVRGSEGRERFNGAAAQVPPESHHVWLDPQVRDRLEPSARRYHQADKQSVEYFTRCVGH